MATYSSNTTIKIGSAITSSASGIGTVTIYTVPANSYLHLWYAEVSATGFAGSRTASVIASGVTLASQTASLNASAQFGLDAQPKTPTSANIILGAGSTITYTTDASASSASGFIRGTLFQNTP